jgi:hypothetical protein
MMIKCTAAASDRSVMERQNQAKIARGRRVPGHHVDSLTPAEADIGVSRGHGGHRGVVGARTLLAIGGNGRCSCRIRPPPRPSHGTVHTCRGWPITIIRPNLYTFVLPTSNQRR